MVNQPGGILAGVAKKVATESFFRLVHLHPLCSVNIPTQLIAQWLQASLSKTNSATTTTTNSVDKQMAENLAQDMSDLMHDFDVVSRINSMVRRKIHWSRQGTSPQYQYCYFDLVI